MIRALRIGRHVMFAGFGAALAWWLTPASFISQVSAELIGFFGFLMAAVLPAMMLTATSIRGIGISSARVNVLYDALREQMLFLSGLFFIAFLAALIVIGFKPFSSCPDLGSCKTIVIFSVHGVTLTTQIINSVLVALVFLLISQFTNVLRGILGLLDLNAQAARNEAEREEEEDIEQMQRDLSSITNPDGYGKNIDLPH
ncbi:hypothetical protein [Salinarimonas ramus]|uniref:Uncharacterized protein n=1 Tax=Salinarimonas ramus TaxID=690164 RepID=A0A917Q684_9HYPH|nr:hypothetical protein [Salinarimonas ramus]GGK27486.1 hypothetical protein GCM10011322_12570 [Salinarimonas ramus]